ncbi:MULTISPECIES: caspase family protein [Azospirillum]|nr:MULTISPECIES: caspase family protein [Azospirillum]MDW7557880.1 caspase family protein [Azospirillum brasilense]MDW7597485.1 caspase family protein [Azospirillum brasilense]MDW7632678.1 caspase family protein [Azospirillum brasilense]MDX5950190.1 caspase family protein [Azospirillum brasilense]OPH11940.1 hypothetical protein FE89_30960 [Azospirillum brasilense]
MLKRVFTVQRLRNAFAVVIISLCGLATSAVQARDIALLVGVSAYPSLPEHRQLRGPMNDVKLMRTALEKLGIKNREVTVLADGTTAAAPPTRAAILAQLDRITAQAGSGDRVLLYFAGHGSRQPAKPEDIGKRSFDGFDAIFLPRDVGRWDGSIRAVQNAIVNHEFRQRIDAIRAKGAFVWAIFDSCHSAYMARGPQEMRVRSVEAAELGIPDPEIAAAQARGVTSRGLNKTAVPLEPDGDNSLAGYAAFFAAQSTETTPEYLLPGDDPKATQHGLFTFHLARAILSAPDASFRRLGDQVLQLYAQNGRTSPTPAFAGPGLDGSWSGAAPGERQWRLARREDGSITMPAGSMHLIGKGSILAILPKAVARDDAALGYVEVVSAQSFTSTVKPVRRAGKPELSGAALHGAVARLVAPAVPLTVRVSKPFLPRNPSTDERRIQRILDAVNVPQVAWTGASDVDVNVRLILEDGRLWFTQTDVPLVKEGPMAAASVAINGDETWVRNEAQVVLNRAVKALNVLRVVGELERGPLDGLALEVRLRRGGAGPGEPVATEGPPLAVRDGDEFDITVRNTGSRHADLTVLYFDSRYNIGAMFPMGGELNRLSPGTGMLRPAPIKIVTASGDGTPGTAGRERLLLIAVEAQPNQPNLDLTFLADPVRRGVRGGERDIAMLFESAGFPLPSVRGAVVPLLERSSVRLIELDVKPGQ